VAGIADRKNALMWAVGWWFVRRMLRRRAAAAVAGVAAGASARRRGIGAVLAALALVGALAAAFVAWRRLAGGSDDEGWEPPDEPLAPMPDPAPEAVAA
jgi:hypothetical protein